MRHLLLIILFTALESANAVSTTASIPFLYQRGDWNVRTPVSLKMYGIFPRSFWPGLKNALREPMEMQPDKTVEGTLEVTTTSITLNMTTPVPPDIAKDSQRRLNRYWMTYRDDVIVVLHSNSTDAVFDDLETAGCDGIMRDLPGITITAADGCSPASLLLLANSPLVDEIGYDGISPAGGNAPFAEALAPYPNKFQ